MKYNHMVKCNGIVYAAGMDVPDEKVKVKESPIAEAPISLGVHVYTADELSGMTVKEIKKIASEKGIELTKVSPKTAVVEEFLLLQK